MDRIWQSPSGAVSSWPPVLGLTASQAQHDWQGLDAASVSIQQANRSYENVEEPPKNAFRNSQSSAVTTIEVTTDDSIQTTASGHSLATYTGRLPASSNVYRGVSYQPSVDNLPWGHASTQTSIANYPQFYGGTPTGNLQPVVNLTAAIYRPAVHVDNGGVNLNLLSTIGETRAHPPFTTGTFQPSNFHLSPYSTQNPNSACPIRYGAARNIEPVWPTTDSALSAADNGSLVHTNQMYHEAKKSIGTFGGETFTEVNNSLNENPPYMTVRLSKSLDNPCRNDLRRSIHRDHPCSSGTPVKYAFVGDQNNSFRHLNSATGSQAGAEFDQILCDDLRRNDIRKKQNSTSFSSFHPYHANRSITSPLTNTSQTLCSKRSIPVQIIRARAMNNQQNQSRSVVGNPNSPMQQHTSSANPVDRVDPASVYLRVLNAKQPHVGQRGKFDLEGLQATFQDQLGLKMLLENTLSSPWYDKELEPRVGSSIGRQFLESVCQLASKDEQFCARVSSILQLPEDETRDMSVYELFKDTLTGNCLFCNVATGRQGLFLGHIRCHLDHRPYVCDGGTACEICAKDGIRRRFYSSKLLREHQAKPTKRVTCNKCRTSVQKAGAARHLSTVHDITTKNWAQYFTSTEPSTPLSQ